MYWRQLSDRRMILSFGTHHLGKHRSHPSQKTAVPSTCPVPTRALCQHSPAVQVEIYWETCSGDGGSTHVGNNMLCITRNSYNCAQARACADLTVKYRLAYLPRELNAYVDLGQTVNITNLCDF